jgi:hypothetical protein
MPDNQSTSPPERIELLCEMFPETSFHVSYAYLPKLFRINVPWHDLEFSGKTFAEAMAKVREYKASLPSAPKQDQDQELGQ